MSYFVVRKDTKVTILYYLKKYVNLNKDKEEKLLYRVLPSVLTIAETERRMNKTPGQF